jgi:hypothetical protein
VSPNKGLLAFERVSAVAAIVHVSGSSRHRQENRGLLSTSVKSKKFASRERAQTYV